MEVTTTEGLGSTTTGLHPVQETVAKCNGSQCGYCTPGMIMAIYGHLAKSGGKAHSGADAEYCVQGNLCRCTGYRPILEGVQKLCTSPPNDLQGKQACDTNMPAERRFVAVDGDSLWINCV